MERSFDIDVLDCPECHRPMKLVAVIAPTIARSILEHLGRATDVPEPRPARAPPDEVWN